MKPRPHQLSKDEWIEENKRGTMVRFNDPILEDSSLGDYETIVLDNILQEADNPILQIKLAIDLSEELVLVIVPDYERGEFGTIGKRKYTGRVLFDQLMRSGLNEGQIKIDHLNEYPRCYWLATCNL